MTLKATQGHRKISDIPLSTGGLQLQYVNLAAFLRYYHFYRVRKWQSAAIPKSDDVKNQLQLTPAKNIPETK